MEEKIIFALYSNKALDNLKSYIKINNQEKVSDYEKSFFYNNNWRSQREKNKKIIQKEKNKKSNNQDYEIKEMLELKDIKFFEDQQKFSKDKETCSMYFYLNTIRNFYSHEKKKDLIEENKKHLDHSEEKILSSFKAFFKNSSFRSFFYNDFDKKTLRILVISLFLNKLNLNDFHSKLDWAENKKIDVCQIWKKYKFSCSKINVNFDVRWKIINYIKNFNDFKNKKVVFIKNSKDLLNYKFKDKNIYFKHAKSSKKQKVNKYLLNVFDKKKMNQKYQLNFNSLQNLFYVYDGNKDIYQLLFNNHFYEQKENPNSDDFNGFTKMVKSENVNVRNLLKILNRIIKYDSNITYEELSSNNFELLHSSFINKNVENLKNNEFFKDYFKTCLNLELNDVKNIDNLKEKIKTFILNYVNNEQKFDEYKNREKSHSNQKYTIKNKKNISKNKKNISSQKLSLEVTKKLHQKFNLNWKNENVKKYVFPIINFYCNIFNKIEKTKNYSFNSDVFTNEEKENLPIGFEIIKDELLSRIPISKNKKIISINEINKLDKLKIQIEPFKEQSFRQILTSKLFLSMLHSYNKTFKLNNVIEENDFNVVKKDFEEYREKEIMFFEKVIFWDDQENNSKKQKMRNMVLHNDLLSKKSCNGDYNLFKEFINELISKH